MGLLFACALLGIPLALLVWDLSRTGDLTLPRRQGHGHAPTATAGHAGGTGAALSGDPQPPVSDRASAG